MARTIAAAISDGVTALARMQSADGSFPLWTGTSGWRPCGPLFSTAYVMIGGGALLDARRIARAVAYIRSQRRADGLWEYDQAIRIPPDSDSTACSLAALVLHGDRSEVIGGADLLRSYWRSREGPFRTWKAAGMWSLPERDDPVVNCNVLCALRLLGSPATEIETAAVQRMLLGGKASRYYCSPATIAHAARRAGLDVNALPALVTARPKANDVLGCAQWLCAMPEGDESLIAALLAAQRPDGAWPIWPWVMAAETPKPYWGSPAITTALALEALGRHARSEGVRPRG
jgi:hypothetical protein